MGFRNIVITSSKILRIQLSNLVIVDKAVEIVRIPISDINSLIIEDRSVMLSSFLLNQLSENNILVFICNEKHLPTTIILPFQNHSKQSKRYKQQFTLTIPFRKNIWKSLISQKLNNQSKVLKMHNKKYYEILLNFSKSVVPGDKNNLEGIGASYYFRALIADNFTRDGKFEINAFMDYSYSIVRGYISRTLVAYGFLPSLGIHHRNEYNNFNLSDDFIEPFRPIIDNFIISSGFDLKNFDTEKKKLPLILNMEVICDTKKYSLTRSVDKLIESFVTCIESSDYSKLSKIEVTTNNIHKYE